jgi:tetrachlorobenzoquinone reductase
VSGSSLRLRVTDVAAEAKDVLALELRDPQGRDLPPVEPGAHLEITLGNGQIRHYSLCHDTRERSRYVIGVGLAAASRGGSRHIHQNVRVGDLLSINAVRNQFALHEGAAHYRFIAGGIGITPIMAMIEHCAARGADWSLLYCVRGRHRAAFLERLAPWGERVRFHFDDEAGGKTADFDAALARPRGNEHIYCCGPAPLMQAVQRAAAGWPDGSVHFEWFAAPVAPAAGAADGTEDGGFALLLRRSGARLEVRAGQSMLEALEANGYAVPFSCREGLCRTCETPLCAGEADHRDFVLSQAEKDAQRSVMLCVSRARTPTLELDL